MNKQQLASKIWESANSIIDDSNTLTEDVLFSTPSGASSFVCGASTNGNVVWKTKEGKTLKTINSESK